LSPFYIVVLTFGAFPLVFTLWVSLHNWELASGTREFVGLDNYDYLLTDADFWRATVNTVGIFVIATVPQLLLALMIANALNRRMRLPTLFRIGIDRKSTRLNSSHVKISYAVFCLKKKKNLLA